MEKAKVKMELPTRPAETPAAWKEALKASGGCRRGAPHRARGWRRWWIYQRERFPILGHGMLIAAFSSSAVSYSFMLRGGPGLPEARGYGLAFVSSFLLFLMLRIADEFKDHEEDCRFRPYRPVPRGLVRLRELGVVAMAAMGLQGVLAWVVEPGLLPWLLIVWIYLGVMGREFFVRDWIRRHPITYLGTHMMIMPLVDFYATACDWRVAGWSAPAGLGWFLALSFGNGVVLELGRKIRGPEDEEPGVETYSALWGRSRAVWTWLAVMGAAAWCAWRAGARMGWPWPAALLGLLAWAGALALGWRFLRSPSTVSAKRLERWSGGWALAIYLCLGAVPMAWHWGHIQFAAP